MTITDEKREQIKNTIHTLVQTQDSIIFKTEEFTFKPLTQNNLEDMKDLYMDQVVSAMVAPATERKPEWVQSKLDSFLKSYKENGISCFAVYEKDDNMIGIAGLTYMDKNKTAIEVNFALKEKYRGKDYSSKITKAALGFTFDKLNIDEIYGECLSYNYPSMRSMLKAGMQPNGKVKVNDAGFIGSNNPKDTYFLKFKITKEQYESQAKEKPTHPDYRTLHDLVMTDYKSYHKDNYQKLTEKYLTDNGTPILGSDGKLQINSQWTETIKQNPEEKKRNYRAATYVSLAKEPKNHRLIGDKRAKKSEGLGVA